jgi:hypothetical protein
MKKSIMVILEECAKDLRGHIDKNEDYGYTEDALQSLEEAIESLKKDEEGEEDEQDD